MITRMLTIALACTIMPLSVGCAATPAADARQLADQLAQALAHRDIERITRDLSRRSTSPATDRHSAVVPIPHHHDVAYGLPRYDVFIARGGDAYIMISGGYAGGVQWRGPVELEAVLDQQGDAHITRDTNPD